jgi:hypothetical protein
MVARAHKHEIVSPAKVYAQLVVMQILIEKIAPNNHWSASLKKLFLEHPEIPTSQMGFPDDWAQRPIWN